MDWQPIETAPKEVEKPILVYVPTHKPKHQIMIVMWREGWNGWHTMPGLYKVRPTLWMPLPELRHVEFPQEAAG